MHGVLSTKKPKSNEPIRRWGTSFQTSLSLKNLLHKANWLAYTEADHHDEIVPIDVDTGDDCCKQATNFWKTDWTSMIAEWFEMVAVEDFQSGDLLTKTLQHWVVVSSHDDLLNPREIFLLPGSKLDDNFDMALNGGRGVGAHGS